MSQLKMSDFDNFTPEIIIASECGSGTSKRLSVECNINKNIMFYTLKHLGDKVETFGVNLERAIERYNQV